MSLVDISSEVVQKPMRSKLITPGPHSPMAETDGARALLERRCSGLRFIEDQSSALESFGQCMNCVLVSNLYTLSYLQSVP